MAWVLEIVLLIVLVSIAGKIILQRMKQNGQERPQVEAENERLRDEIGDLKARIATLERIATDKSRRLSDEIDALDRDR